jgi:hypothetical protein
MKTNWLAAWWHQLTRRPVADPWNHDPEIVRERDRQHRDGVTDAATAYRNRDWWNERLRESWRAQPDDT